MGLNKFVEKFDTKQVVLITTLLLFLFFGSEYRYIKIPLGIVCLLGLATPVIRTSKCTWFAILAIFLVGNSYHFFEIDNHKFLFFYWTLAIFACLFSENFEDDLKVNAKLLIGTVFGLSVLWKLLSPDYLNDSFFLCTFLTDIRCITLFKALHLLPEEMIVQNRDALNFLVNDSRPPIQVTLKYTQGIYSLSLFFTCATIIIEAVISILFLLPEKFRITKFRDYPFFVFLITAYLVAPIWGFGSILSIMGIAQSDSKRKSLGYLLLLLVMMTMLIFRVPFSQIVSLFSRHL